VIRGKKKLTPREIEKARIKQAEIDKITQVVALIFAFGSVYYFFIKLLFL